MEIREKVGGHMPPVPPVPTSMYRTDQHTCICACVASVCLLDMCAIGMSFELRPT